MQEVNTQPAFPSNFLELKEKVLTGLGIMCMNLCVYVCFSVHICVRQTDMGLFSLEKKRFWENLRASSSTLRELIKRGDGDFFIQGQDKGRWV